MIYQITISAILIVLSSIVHLFATKFAIGFIKRATIPNVRYSTFRKLFWLDVVVILMIVASIVEASIWALFYTSVNALESLSKALYFSIVTYTTLGYGDISLGPDWRIVASLQAAAGIIIFGWSTAVVMAAIQNLYFTKKSDST